jgi:hypothetical protein
VLKKKKRGERREWEQKRRGGKPPQTIPGYMQDSNLSKWRQVPSGVASLTIWSCYANISVFINRENNQFLKK